MNVVLMGAAILAIAVPCLAPGALYTRRINKSIKEATDDHDR